MWMILLGGTIVNSSILLLDFILGARKKGTPKEEAILEAVRLRIRPITIIVSPVVYSTLDAIGAVIGRTIRFFVVPAVGG